MNSKRHCGNCLKGTFININGDILCIEKGVVSCDYVCSKHRYLPALKSIKRKINTCKDCEHFIMMDTARSIEDRAMGICQLFTVRKFDGRKRKTCSKFIKRSKKEVS